MIYVTSDTHFNHANIVDFCESRSHFADVEQMNAALVDSINEVVKQTDQLYFVGDFALRGNNDEEIPKILKRIYCQHKHLVFGNHDKHRHGQFFETANELLEVKWNHQRYILCHYPLESWRRSAMMLHGHWHGTGPKKALRLDIGVDGPDGKQLRGPWSLDEVRDYIIQRDNKDNLEKMYDERRKKLGEIENVT